MRLVIPIFQGGSPISSVNFCQPSPGALADVSNAAENGNYYEAVRSFVAGSIQDVDDQPVDRQRAKAVAGAMPFQSAMQAIIEISKAIKGDDAVSGVYECPECGEKNYAQKKGDIDLRDHTDDLERIYMEGQEETFAVDLETPAEVQDIKGEILTSVSKLHFRWPTLNDCVKCAAMSQRDKNRLQMAIFAECIVKCNNDTPDAKWKNRYGKLIFERMDLGDYKRITAAFNRYRINLEVARVCRDCDSPFEEEINVRSFFVSALRTGAPEGASNGPSKSSPESSPDNSTSTKTRFSTARSSSKE